MFRHKPFVSLYNRWNYTDVCMKLSFILFMLKHLSRRLKDDKSNIVSVDLEAMSFGKEKTIQVSYNKTMEVFADFINETESILSWTFVKLNSIAFVCYLHYNINI